MARRRRTTKAKGWGRLGRLLPLLLILLGYLGYRALSRSEAAAPSVGTQTLGQAGDSTVCTPPYTPLGAIEDEIINGDTTLLEMPRLAGGNANYYVTHRASGRVTYSLEYDVTRLHARWVCFSFTPETAVKEVSRSEAWAWDPKVPARYNTASFFRRSGYSRGHLVASEDRVYSPEANEQTFYYTNMSPQLQAHNAGIWHRLERRVQDWADDRGLCDTLYVAKGGTIADGQIEPKRMKGRVVVPRYYWMAVLARKGGQYHAIAFWTEHRSYGPSVQIPSLTLSVRELEQRTGLDFFYHLPDAVEEAAEIESPTSREALRRWWHQ